METTTTPTPTVATPAAVTPTPAKKARVIKTPATKKAEAPKAKVKAAPAAVVAKVAVSKVNAHAEAGVNAKLYAGLSGMLNSNRKTAIMVAAKRATSTMTERHQKSLYALRGAYEGKSFGAKGFDNGVMRDLMAAGLITVSGGVQENVDGKIYHFDGTTPVMVKLTKEGLAYGKA